MVILELKIQLRGVTKPPVWRKVEVSGEDTLYDLHNIIQGAMGWYDAHLHQFIIFNNYFSLPNPYDEFDNLDERKFRLKDIFREKKQKITYEYDFGDCWEHHVTLIAKKEPEKGVQYPRLTGGKSMCPPEDCGGIWGYMELRDILNDPNDPQYADMRGWLGMEEDEYFNPKYFDREDSEESMLTAYRQGKSNTGKKFSF